MCRRRRSASCACWPPTGAPSWASAAGSALEPFRERISLLQTIPGIDRPSACAILAEIGPDLDAFASAEHLAAWAGVCPGNSESAGKRRSTRTRSGSVVFR